MKNNKGRQGRFNMLSWCDL